MRKLARARPTQFPPPDSSSNSTSAATIGQDTGIERPVVKRPRKAINCEPCRANKLKCDRKRPCSSCELRGTSSQCYRDAVGLNFDVVRNVDPLGELGKMRQALASLERYYQTPGSGPSVTDEDGNETALSSVPEGSLGAFKRGSEVVDEGLGTPGQSGPGSRGGQAGGYYAGPTSTASHLLGHDLEYVETPPSPLVAQDDYIAEVLAALPDYQTIDGIIDYYFMHCQWIYRRLVESIFRAQWATFKASRDTDCLIIATCCGVLALAMVYIPEEHPLKQSAARKLGPRPNESLYTLMETARKRYEKNRGGLSYSLEYAEFLLLRAHYHLYATHDAEEVWAAKSYTMCVATAMGLHRDPALWKMPVEVAERRRWLWWHIIALERWQSFVLGRPPSIANHHYDTQLPSLTLDPSQNMSTYAVALRMFRLGVIVGDILDTVLSLRPVPYKNIQQLDDALERWEKDLPSEWMMSAEEMDLGLRSNDVPVLRRTLQIISILASCCFIRFTLHRQYAARVPTPTANTGDSASDNIATTDSVESAKIAASYAERLIDLSMRCRRDQDSRSKHLFATRGHLAFHTFYLFSAAMFFSFQLIATPTGPRSVQCHTNITRAQNTLKSTPLDIPGGRLAANATKTLDALARLWEDDFVHMPDGPDKEDYKVRVLDSVRTLAFPFHQSDQSGSGDHPINPIGMSHGGGVQPRETMDTQSTLFGSTGILRPDMSVLGRVPIVHPGTYHSSEHPPAPPHTHSTLGHNDSAQVWSHGMGYTSTMTGSSSSLHPDHRQSTLQEHALPSDMRSYSLPIPGLSDLEAPLRAPVQPHSQSYDYGPSHHMYDPSINPIPDAFGRPTDMWGVSQGMPWGASVGIAAGEWAGFMQNMASPSMMVQPPTNPVYDYYHEQAQQPEHAYRDNHL